MKSIITILAILLTLSSCSKDDAPQIEINIQKTESSNWKSVELNTGDISFITKVGESIGKSLIQMFDGADLSFDTSASEVKPVGEFSHIELLNTIGIDPYFTSISVTDNNDEVFNVIIDRNSNEFIEYFTSFDFENNFSYVIEIEIDPDVAFSKTNDGVSLNYDGLSMRIPSSSK